MSLTDTNDNAAGILNLAYDQTRQELIRNFDWNCARQRAFAPLVPNVTPAFDFLYTYLLPNDLLRLCFVGKDKARFDRRRHEIQGRYLMTNLIPNNEFAGVGYNTGQYTQNILNVTNANPGIITVATTGGLTDGQSILISGVDGMTELNGPRWTMLDIGPTFFTLGDIYGLPFDTTSFDAYQSGGVIQSIYPLENNPPNADANSIPGTPCPNQPIIYMRDLTEVPLMDALFRRTLILQLACNVCMPITGDQGLLQTLEAKLKQVLAEAVATNHQERPVVVTEREPITEARWAESDFGWWGSFGYGMFDDGGYY